jgi:hypothetical protein
MNGLRVYVKATIAETYGGRDVFYSRREDGPYYRWVFDETVSEWRVGRVSTSRISGKDVALAPWKKLPAALQRSMVEHYQDD